MIARDKVAFAQFEPGDFCPLGERHQIGGQIVRRGLVPRSAIDAPLKGRAHELKTDAIPNLVFSVVFEVEFVREQTAIGGQLFGNFLGVEAEIDPFAFRQKLCVPPTSRADFEVGRSRIFRLNPHGVIILCECHRIQPKRGECDGGEQTLF